MNLRLALISPIKNAFSESFIQAHRRLDAKVFYYYNGLMPTELENYGEISYNRDSIRKPMLLLSRLCNPRLLLYPRRFSLRERFLAHSFKKNRIEAVLAEYGTCAIEIMMVCRYLKIPLIAHFHGYDISVHEIVQKNEHKYKELFGLATNIIVVSRLMETTITHLGCPKHKILYNPCGPDDRFYDIHPNYYSSQVLCIGRYVDKKSPYNVILAFEKVLQEIPDANLVMIGDGPLFEACYNIARNIGILDSVNFKGVVSHDELDKYLENSTCFVQSSITAFSGDKEGTPVSVMEASLSGLPVVATNHAGILDVIIDKKTGFIVEENDVEELAKSIVKVLKDKKLAQEMGQAGKENIFKNFRLSLSLAKINDLLFNIKEFRR